MSSTYLPPHMRYRRNKKDDPPAKEFSIKVSEQTFPSLGNNSVTKQSRWNGSTTFAKLATNWNEDETMRIAEAERRKKESENETKNGNTVTGTPNLYNILNKKVDPQHEDHDELDADAKETVDDEWNNVTYRKPRKVRTLEEIAEQEELENQAQKEADDMWADEGPETHQTYWDQRY